MPRHRRTYANTRTQTHKPGLTTKYPENVTGCGCEKADLEHVYWFRNVSVTFRVTPTPHPPITHTTFCTKTVQRCCISFWLFKDMHSNMVKLWGWWWWIWWWWWTWWWWWWWWWWCHLAAWYGIFSLCWCVWLLHHGRCGMLLQDTAWHHHRAGDTVRELITSTHTAVNIIARFLLRGG